MFTRTDFLKPFRFATIGFSITVLFVVYQLLANLDLFSLREFLPMIVFAILSGLGFVAWVALARRREAWRRS